jgi:hypothetical protein
MVKYWYTEHENRECCPQHGALTAFSVSLAFSAVAIGKFWDLGLRHREQIGQTGQIIFGTEFVVKYGHTKHEI